MCNFAVVLECALFRNDFFVLLNKKSVAFFFFKHLIKLLCRESFFRLLRHNLSILNDIRSMAFSLHKFSLIANYGFSLPTRGYALLEAQNVTFFSHWNVNFCHFTY